MNATTIDLGDDDTMICEQHRLVERLAQLAEIRDRGAFADDHVVNLLLRRYTEVRADIDFEPLSA